MEEEVGWARLSFSSFTRGDYFFLSDVDITWLCRVRVKHTCMLRVLLPDVYSTRYGVHCITFSKRPIS